MKKLLVHSRLNFFKNTWPVFLWALIILILSGIPGDSIPEVPTFLEWLKPDKIVHIVLFGTFSLLILRALIRQYETRWRRFNYVLLAIMIGTIFGLMNEALQKYIFINRSGNWLDAAADFIGCLTGWLVFAIFFKKKAHTYKNN